jgi:hypothetical protein
LQRRTPSQRRRSGDPNDPMISNDKCDSF